MYYTENDFRLYHHGIKGMKWGVRHGPPYPLKNSSDITIKKNTKLARYSGSKETKLRTGSYASVKKNDVRQYRIDSLTNQLGFKGSEKIYKLDLEAVDNLTVRNGKAVIQDCLNDIGDKTVNYAFNILDEAGYFDAWGSYDRYKIWTQSKDTDAARKVLGGALHKYVYADRKKFIDKYKKLGYDAVVDPEDYVWNYEMPLIIANASKIKIKDITDITEDKKRFTYE